MRTNLVARGAGLLCAFFLFVVPSEAAQNAGAILQTALDRYEQRVRGIDDYRVTYSFMGQEHSTYMQKQMIEGHPVFLPVDQDDDAGREWGNPYRLFPELAERAEVVGTETIDGVQAHGLRIDDFEGLEFDMPAGTQDDFEPRSLTLWIGTSEYLIRKMDIAGVSTVNGQERPIEITALMQDYRTVEGMPHPFRTTIRAEGALSPGGGTSEEEAAEMQERFAELDRQMAKMSPAQREMMEKMMGGQTEQLRKMTQSGSFEMELVVTDLEVNTGPPADS